MSRPDPFPKTRPLDDPPDLRDTIRYGRRTPSYALAWVCTGEQYGELLPKGALRNLSNMIHKSWVDKYGLPYAQRPQVYLGADGKYYLIAMFNEREYPRFAKRALDPEDPLIVAARAAMFVSQELEPTLMWYRYPMRWPLYSSESDDEA